MIRVGSGVECLAGRPPQAFASHDLGHAFLSTAQATCDQFGMDSGASIGTTAFLKHLRDLAAQLPASLRPAAWRPVPPSIVTAARDPQNTAHHSNWPSTTMFLDEGEALRHIAWWQPLTTAQDVRFHSQLKQLLMKFQHVDVLVVDSTVSMTRVGVRSGNENGEVGMPDNCRIARSVFRVRGEVQHVTRSKSGSAAGDEVCSLAEEARQAERPEERAKST